MLTLLCVLIGVVAIGMVVSGLLALITNPSKVQNRWFFTFTSILGVWTTINFIDSNYVFSNSINELLIKTDFIFSILLAWCFMFFAQEFNVSTYESKHSPRFVTMVKYSTSVLNVLLVFLTIIGSVVATSTSHHKVNVSYNLFFNIYAFIIVAYLIYGLAILINKYRSSRGGERSAINLILMGLALAVTSNLLTNLVFPIYIASRSVVKELNIIGYLGLFVLALTIYVAITTRRLFDVRLIVARSLAYILSLVSIAGLFIVISFAFTDVIFKGSQLSGTATRWLFTILAVVLAYTFPVIKRFFDKQTKHIFYRDSYDAQVFLDQLNNVLVGTFKIEPLLSRSAKVIQDNLKPSFCEFYINKTAYTRARRIGAVSGQLSSSLSLEDFDKALIKSRRKFVVLQEMEGKDHTIEDFMRNNNIEVITKLATSSKTESSGYLVFGLKKSGNSYNQQDIKIIEIVTNELVIAVQNSLRFEEIENFNVTLQQKVVDATQKLRTANEKLRALDETKDDFISMASHQLRTPLTSVKGYLSMVMEGDAGKLSEQQKEMLGQAFFSSQRMVYLISDLLNVSRLKTGKFIIEPSPINLATMVQQELAQLQETAKAKQLTLTYEKPDKFPNLMLDETKTRQVIMNFCDNAIYYTPAGGHIKVEVIDKPSTVELRVVDDGIGVPRSEQHHLFTKFYRAGNARKARPDGTGLGLFMAKKVVVAQGGSIILESTEGKGSTFGFSFNKDKHQVTDKQQSESDKKKATGAV